MRSCNRGRAKIAAGAVTFRKFGLVDVTVDYSHDHRVGGDIRQRKLMRKRTRFGG